MRQNNFEIIADTREAVVQRRVGAGLVMAGLIIGVAAAAFYARQDLTLSHYDARAHLVVARRLFDSLTPGWRQIGAVWLPLPHVVNAPFVLPDWSFRTGALPTLVSIAALSVGLSVLGRYLFRRTRSIAAALSAPALILLNPNVLYLQSTPMTEPLLLGLSCIALAAVDAWVERPDTRNRRVAGLAIVLLALTRYEGWCIGAALVAIAALARRQDKWRALALVPFLVGAIAGFFWLSWATTGEWFVSSGFFVPENPSLHRPWSAAAEIVGATRDLAGAVILTAAAAGAFACVHRARQTAGSLLPFALACAGALPWLAFVQGHPHRVRYMVPLVAASGVLAGWAIAMVPSRGRIAAALALIALALAERPPVDAQAPMVMEAQWEAPFRRERRTVTAHLGTHYDGTPILASMGSLGHYMQEASAIHLPLSAFLHEGNGDLWTAALAHPGRLSGWMLIEERAEGGDVLAHLLRQQPMMSRGFTRVAEGGGLALYRRDQPPPP
jgi:hypothetical protein